MQDNTQNNNTLSNKWSGEISIFTNQNHLPEKIEEWDVKTKITYLEKMSLLIEQAINQPEIQQSIKGPIVSNSITQNLTELISKLSQQPDGAVQNTELTEKCDAARAKINQLEATLKTVAPAKNEDIEKQTPTAKPETLMDKVLSGISKLFKQLEEFTNQSLENAQAKRNAALNSAIKVAQQYMPNKSTSEKSTSSTSWRSKVEPRIPNSKDKEPPSR